MEVSLTNQEELQKLYKGLFYIFVIVVVVFIIYKLLTRQDKKENFESNFDPRNYTPELSSVTDESPFVGLPKELIPPWELNPRGYSEVDILDDGMNGNAGINFNICSKSCCSKQYPPPFGLPTDKMVCNSEEKYVPNNYMCNDGWNDTGCLCLTEKQSRFLNTRGGNQ